MALAKRIRVWLILAALTTFLRAEVLPIYLEDSHAGSFAFFAQKLDLNEEHTLILYDAHSDASGIPNSDQIRDQLRKVISLQQRQKRIQQWMIQGHVQPHNWIEPLMPRPISKVIWVAGSRLSNDQIQTLQSEAAVHLDWLTEVVPRKNAELSNRFVVTDEQHLSNLLLEEASHIVSIDLDYFAQSQQSTSSLKAVWQQSLATPNLKAVSIAVSRPWLKSSNQANQLSSQAIQLALSVRNARVQIEPFAPRGVDTSERAKSLYLEGKQPPRWLINDISLEAKQSLLSRKNNILVTHNPAAWETLLLEWRGFTKKCQITLDNHQVSTDGVWRCDSQNIPHIRLKGAPPSCTVKWYQLSDTSTVHNVLPKLLAGKSFTHSSTPYILEEAKLIATTQTPALSSQIWRLVLPHKQQWGALRIQAIVTTQSAQYATPVTHIRVGTQSDFHKALAEQFGTSYVFGIGTLTHDGETGPETLLGNDCANFLVYAWRRNGRAMPWCNPAQLRKQLHLTHSQLTLADRPTITSTQVTQGTAVHLDTHVAAIWKDLPPLGELDPSDLVAHHLSGPPEIITLQELMKGRNHYDLYTLPLSEDSIKVTIAGDMNLASEHTPIRPMQPWQDALQRADFTVANLECCFTHSPSNSRSKRFQFCAQPERVAVLKQLGIDALSLANNHSYDGGIAGIKDTLATLKKQQMGCFGFPSLESPSHPTFIKNIKQTKVALIGVNCIETNLAPDEMICWPRDKHRLLEHLRQARQQADTLIVMPHWGEEYTEQVTKEQRVLAKWLIANGADAIMGSHSHHPQPLDCYRGTPICYSLGNLWFPNKGPRGFNLSTLCTLHLNPNGVIESVHTTTFQNLSPTLPSQ